MKVTEIRERAKAMGLAGTARLKKGDLIRRIQTKEGNTDCFESEGRFQCTREECCWRPDCLTLDPS